MFSLSETLPRTLSSVHVDLATLNVESDLDPTPPATPAPTPKPFDAAGREARGLEIATTRAIVGFGNVYLVAPSKPGAEPYVVTVTPFGTTSCDCPDYRFRCQPRNANCKHGVAVLAQIAAATEGKVAA